MVRETTIRTENDEQDIWQTRQINGSYTGLVNDELIQMKDLSFLSTKRRVFVHLLKSFHQIFVRIKLTDKRHFGPLLTVLM